MLPKPKSEEVMIIIAELLELEKTYWIDYYNNRLNTVNERWFKKEQKKLFKKIAYLVDKKGG